MNKILNDEKINSFIKSAKSQNAEIISDVLSQNNGVDGVSRLITKKLPSGTEITHSYYAHNDLAWQTNKYILSKKFVPHTQYDADVPEAILIKYNDGSGLVRRHCFDPMEKIDCIDGKNLGYPFYYHDSNVLDPFKRM